MLIAVSCNHQEARRNLPSSNFCILHLCSSPKNLFLLNYSFAYHDLEIHNKKKPEENSQKDEHYSELTDPFNFEKHDQHQGIILHF